VSVASYIFGILTALFTLGVVIEMLRRNRMRERHAMWWLIAGTFALIVGIFPSILAWATQALGVGAPTNLVFFVSIAVLFLVCIQHSSELTTSEAKLRTLTEELVLQQLREDTLEQRIAELEAQRK
jgi:hypothetical protein